MSESRERPVNDLAGQEFWHDVWTDAGLPEPVRTDGTSVRDSAFAAQLASSFSHADSVDRIIEVGCARSVWLSHLAMECGFGVAGLDYSPEGCELSRAVLKRDGVDGDVRCADLFSPPEDFVGTFDAALSFGVVEHFDDTREALSAIASLVRPGGLVITEVPNLAGLAGKMLRWANPPVYAAHHVIDRAALRKAHETAGLQVLSCEYLMSVGFSAVSLQSTDSYVPSRASKRVVSGLHRASDLVWRFERVTSRLPVSRALSPFVWCVARVPAE